MEPTYSIPKIENLLANAQSILSYDNTKSGNQLDISGLLKGPYHKQLLTVTLTWCLTNIHIGEDEFKIWKESYGLANPIRYEFIAFLAENLISSKSYSLLNNSPIFSYTIKTGSPKKPKQSSSNKLLLSICDEKTY